MKKALVLDAGQDMGHHLCQALVSYQWSVTAAINDPSQPISLHHDLTLAEVTKHDVGLLAQLIKQTDTIFLHLPESPLTGQMTFSIDIILSLITKYRRHLVITTNQYEQEKTRLFSTLFKPKSKPVSIKLPGKLTAQLQQSADLGASITVIGCGHNLNLTSRCSYLKLLIKETHKQLIIQSPSNYGTRHYWTYLPDLAKNIVHKLSTRPSTCPSLNINFYPGHQASMKDIARCLALSSGKPVSVTNLQWTVIEVIALFSPLFRQFFRMRILWQQGGLQPQANNDWGRKAFVHTPLELALQHSWNNKNNH
ncbi:hypothetical protein [Photobacterium minamisatsumaniensis]|uniref:hypothetical protein n=1 Tax=Photobacterium minamisatsumaniensis TaxID=2910233 RepID=UPI003D09DED8